MTHIGHSWRMLPGQPDMLRTPLPAPQRTFCSGCYACLPAPTGTLLETALCERCGAVAGCWCRRCIDALGERSELAGFLVPPSMCTFVVCPDCHDKRCPR